MSKIKIDNYSFDKATKKVTFTDYTTIRLDAILLITNTTHNIIIYNFADPLKGGTIATNVLTLTYDTSAMANTDKLLIYYDDYYGYNRTAITGRNLSKTAQVSPMRCLSTFKTVRLCGTPFHGTVKNPVFWSETGTVTNGSVTITGGQAILTVTTDSGSAAVYTTTRIGRYISGAPNKWRAVVRLPDIGTAANNNKRNWGCFSATDGFMFQLNAATLNIVIRKRAVADQVIAKAAWTGTYAAAFTLDTNVHTYEIQYTNTNVYFFIDDNIVHTVTGLTAPNTETLTFPCALENINTGIGPAVSLNCRTSAISRLGEPQSRPIHKYSKGAVLAGAGLLKTGPGTIHGVVNGNNKGTLALYDCATTGALSGQIILFDLVQCVGTIPFGLEGVDFNIGLIMVQTDGAAETCIIFE
jgi:hypothetical protein